MLHVQLGEMLEVPQNKSEGLLRRRRTDCKELRESQTMHHKIIETMRMQIFCSQRQIA